MIGTHRRGYKIIAALPVNGNSEGHMIVVGQSLPQLKGRHQATFVTWFTDGQGVLDSPVHYSAHDISVGTLRNMAIGNMIRRAGHTLSPLNA